MIILEVLGCLAVLVIAILGIAAHVAGPRKPRYCTKHVVVRQGPFGPDRVKWLYGPHRTQGNACDGALHKRAAWWR